MLFFLVVAVKMVVLVLVVVVVVVVLVGGRERGGGVDHWEALELIMWSQSHPQTLPLLTPPLCLFWTKFDWWPPKKFCQNYWNGKEKKGVSSFRNIRRTWCLHDLRKRVFRDVTDRQTNWQTSGHRYFLSMQCTNRWLLAVVALTSCQEGMAARWHLLIHWFPRK